MSIRIETEKIVVRGEQMRKIEKIDLLEKNELPALYTDGESVHQDGDYIAYRTEDGMEYYFLGQGKTYTKDALLEKLKIIKRCGNRLMEINKALTKANANWHGKETVVI